MVQGKGNPTVFMYVKHPNTTVKSIGMVVTDNMHVISVNYLCTYVTYTHWLIRK